MEQRGGIGPLNIRTGHLVFYNNPRGFFANASTIFKSFNITPDQVDALKSCIEGGTVPAEAAKHLAGHPETSPTPLELQQRLGGLWTLLNHAAVALPSAQPTIISILQAIRTLPRVEEPKGEGEDYFEFDDGFFWRELTGWTSAWADDYNFHASQYLIDSDKDKYPDALEAAWASANSYTARLAMTGDPALSSYGVALDRGVRTIIHTLEVKHNGIKPAELKAAAQLFIHAAPVLQSQSKEQRAGNIENGLDGHLSDNKPRGSHTLWGGKGGFSPERWSFWKERWVFLAEDHGLPSEARDIAQQALGASENAEVQRL